MRARTGRSSRRTTSTAATTTTTARASKSPLRIRGILRGMLPHARALGILVLLAGPAAAAPLAPLPPQPAGVPWPTTAWPTAEPEVTPGALDRLLAVTAAPQPLLGETRAVVVGHR